MPELLSVKVVRKSDEAVGICTFELVSVSGDPLPGFTAGAHIDVHIGDRLCRQYSLCNDPAEHHRYMIGVLREPQSRGGSRAMHEAIKEGDTLQISSPRNLFALEPSGKHALLFAGGIGITPILCMAEHLSAVQADFHMHYSGRTLSRMAFIDRIEQARFANFVSIHVDDGAPKQKLDISKAMSDAPKDAHIYVCGPTGFIEAVVNQARQAGWPSSHIHFEYFAAGDQTEEGDTDFDVKLAGSGAVVHVAANESVVAALARNGIEIETSCEQGICGTCLTGVLEGEPDHRDAYLSDAERTGNKVFLPCCSRSRTEMLVLDL